jgi:hypothetical protein
MVYLIFVSMKEPKKTTTLRDDFRLFAVWLVRGAEEHDVDFTEKSIEQSNYFASFSSTFGRS